MIDLFRKWLAGSIKWTEEKQLRKEAETDTFLADAMEGYELLPTVNHAKKLSALQEQLKQTHYKKQPKVAPYFGRAIAASLVLLLSASLFFLLQNPLRNQAPLSDIGVQEKSTNASGTTTENVSYSKSAPLAAKEKTSSNISEAVTTIDKKVADLQKNRQAKPTPPPQPTTKIIEPNSIEETTINNTGLAESSKKTPINKKESVLIEEPQSDLAISKEQTPIESIITAEDAAEKELASMESEAIRTEQLPVMKEEAAMPSNSTDIAVSARAAPKAQKIESIESPIASPVGGMKKFKRYIKKNLKQPISNKPIADELLPNQKTVLLHFSITNTGEVTDIKVIKGINSTYDQEAIRLIKEGPKWNSNGATIGVYEVVFK